MKSPRTGLPRRPKGRRWSTWAGLAILGLAPSTGCQVHYAGMTLPSGKYMRDDVQYFPPGPDFPYANTQAATQRARIAAMGEVPPPVAGVPMGPAAPAPIGGLNRGGPGAGAGIPRPGPMPEIEAQEPGGPGAPNPVEPGVNGAMPVLPPEPGAVPPPDGGMLAPPP